MVRQNTAGDIRRHRQMAAQMAALIPAGGSVLEVAPGPGYFIIELARLGDYRLTGLDISQTFVDICRQNAAAAGVAADCRRGDAAAMPFAADTFDLIFCQAAFKNFTRPVEAIAEMHRVLRPGGRAVIVDLRHDASLAEIDQEVAGMGLGVVNAAFTRLAFRTMLLKSAYSAAQMEGMIAQTQFRQGQITLSGIGFEAVMTK